jgi:hypothetical protein
MSARRIFLTQLKEKFQKLGRYHVKRGAILWPKWDFKKYPKAVSIVVDSETILGRHGINTATVSIECFSRIPSQNENDPMIDDDLQEELIDDVKLVLSQMKLEKHPDGSGCTIFRIGLEDAELIEAHDAIEKVQGYVLSFEVVY